MIYVWNDEQDNTLTCEHGRIGDINVSKGDLPDLAMFDNASLAQIRETWTDGPNGQQARVHKSWLGDVLEIDLGTRTVQYRILGGIFWSDIKAISELSLGSRIPDRESRSALLPMGPS